MLPLLLACVFDVKFSDSAAPDDDTDTDADTDTDTDTDADADADTDTDTETGTWPDRSVEDADTVLYGDQDADGTGITGSLGAGELTGDGGADLFVGSTGWSTTDLPEVGRVYVVSRPEARAQGIGTAAHAWIDGASRAGRFGTSVAGAGDLNGDGHDDLVVGEVNTDTAYVFHGPITAGAHTVAEADLVLTSDGERSGSTVAAAGDVDGDGWADLIVQDGSTSPAEGNVYLALNVGGTGSVHLDDDAFSVVGSESRERAGTGPAITGDLDGDGALDLVVGAPYAEFGGAGVYHGPFAAGEVSFDDADTWLSGPDPGEYTGGALAFADLDADGYADLAVGSAYAAKVFFHRGGARAGATVDLGGAPQLQGDADYTGIALSSAGDVDGDGFVDLLVGASFRESGEGGAWLAYGPISPGIDHLGAGEQHFLGNTAASLLGAVLVGGEDIDGDGDPDVVLGGRYSDIEDRGAIYLFSGG